MFNEVEVQSHGAKLVYSSCRLFHIDIVITKCYNNAKNKLTKKQLMTNKLNSGFTIKNFTFFHVELFGNIY